ncbi:unnamed protein product, partial [Rotaria magnacalcarata]
MSIEKTLWKHHFEPLCVKDAEVLKTRLWIIFDGERGLDYGG